MSQPPIRILNPTGQPTAGDARMNQFEDPKGASWRVFAVDSLPEAPVVIAQVGEVKQHNPPKEFSLARSEWPHINVIVGRQNRR